MNKNMKHILIIMALIFFGCSSTRSIRMDNKNQRTIQGGITIVLKNGDKFYSRKIVLLDDSIFFNSDAISKSKVSMVQKTGFDLEKTIISVALMIGGTALVMHVVSGAGGP